MNPPTIPKTLNRRPEARGFRVEQLLQEAEAGRLRVPPFQRPLRWKSKQVIAYFDSIRRGFPVGNLLLSRGRAPAEKVDFGGVSVDAPERHDALWVVDGQQRITALVATLARKETTPKRDCWAIWYDLKEERFVRLSQKEPGVSWIPLNVVNNSVLLLKWIKNWPYADDNPEWVDRALELGKAIREYEVPAYIVDGADEQLLRLIFTRVNTAGVGMRESEIFEARYGKEGHRPIRNAVARLRDTGFGPIDEDLFLRCLRSTCEISGSQATDAPEAVDSNSIGRTEKAIRRAIVAIQESAEIPHCKLLPYQMPLIFLSAFFDRFPAENIRVDRLAAKWIWHGALTGDHQDSTDAKINRLLKLSKGVSVADEALAALIQGITRARGQLPNQPDGELERAVSMNRATGKIFVLGLLAAKPQSARSGTGCEQREFDFDDIDVDSDDATSSTPSQELDLKRLLLPLFEDGKQGTDVVIKTDGLQRESFTHKSDREFLRSHVLDERCVELLVANDAQAFRKHRSELLRAYFDQFVRDRWGDRQDWRPSIGSIIETPAPTTSSVRP